MTNAWLLAAALAGRAFAAAPADLILRGGRIFLEPGHYAAALAVRGNRVDAVGDDSEIDAMRGPATRVIDLAGRAAVPGFHDGHVRLLDGALSLDQVDVSSAAAFDDVRAVVSAFAASHPSDPWIVGFGWRTARLGRLPTSADLDAAVAARPVALFSADGGMVWLNGEGLKRAHIERAMVLKRGGKVVRDEKGKPTGLLVGDAVKLASREFPKPDEERQLAALRAALALARRDGVTSVDAMPDDAADAAHLLALWTRLALAGEATLRVSLFGDLDDPKVFAALKASAEALPRTRLLLRGVVAGEDGPLARREAALLADYSDVKSDRGDLDHSKRWLDSRMRASHELELQPAVAAHGDAAVRRALDACEEAEASARDSGLVLPRYPCRLEAATLVDPEDVPRFAALRAAASVQLPSAAGLGADPDALTRMLGGRVSYVLPWRSLDEAQALLVFGSGWPDGPLSPLSGLALALSRTLVPEQRLSLEPALAHYTLDPARADGMADQLGSLVPGRLADIVVLDRDVFKDQGKTLSAASVDATIFDGKVVYERR